MKRLLALALLASPLHAAHPGETIYQTLCIACHGPDGKGVGEAENKFPPLYKSDWVRGDARRTIQVVLHGLAGEITVNDKSYNLVMPPHGGSMTDQQIADVVTYVRSNFGNKGSAVNVAMVKEQRDQKDNPELPNMWNPKKLLKKYPLRGASKKPPINDLLSYIHHGDFKTLAALRASEAKNAEEEKAGLISLKHADRNEKFGLVWTGWLDVPRDGTYQFTYDTDDGGAISINDKEIITRDRIGPAGQPTTKKVKLKKGRAEIKIEYFEYTGQESISLMWNGPGIKNVALSEGATKQKSGNPVIMLKAPAGEATIYRNFIEGTDPRGIGVGYSEGVNLAFSGDSMSLDMIWTGDFIDAGRHWTARGQGFQGPAGDDVVTVNRGLAFALLESQTEAWPSAANDKLKPTFKGYQLNKARQPGFAYLFGGIQITDQPIPTSSTQLTRTITLEIPESAKSDDTLYFRALSGGAVTPTGEREFTFENLTVSVPKSEHPPFARQNELLIPIPLTAGTHTIQLTYTWN
ncbi:MAG: PA14 domain-containing protein [Verrucomicrobiaceae bacterium]